MPFSRTVAASGHVQEGTNATVLVPDVQPSAIVKAGALITVVITRGCKPDRIYNIVIISMV